MQISQLCPLVSDALWLMVPLHRTAGYLWIHLTPHHPSVPVTSINRDIAPQKTDFFNEFFFFCQKQ